MDKEEVVINKPDSLEHLAIIMDGNGRWAMERGEPRIAGHRRGADVVRDITTACRRMGLAHLTLYSFFGTKLAAPTRRSGRAHGLAM